MTGRERVARVAYSTLWFVATPVIAGYLLWRSRRQPEYRRHWGERFLGRYATGPSKACLWIHAVSVGETRAASGIIEGLLAAHPDHDVVVTHMTPTGRETACAMFGDRVHHAYLAYDYPHAVAAFLRHWRPRVGIVMETEIWPNVMVAAARARVPLLLANARLSPKSLTAANRWPALMRPAARAFTRILAQTDSDAQRFAILTASEGSASSSIVTIGNVKFDADVPPAQHALAARFRAWFEGTAEAGSAPPHVVLAASTRDGEEAALLDAWVAHARGEERARHDGTLLLVIVPRHPQRFDEVAALARERGLVVARRSDDVAPPGDVDVWIGDSMGELWAYYLAAEVAYVGGSIAPLGGQNLIEAAAAGCPILIGPHTFNFAVASDDAVKRGAALRVGDYVNLVNAAVDLAYDRTRRRRMREAGLAFAAAHRGATVRTLVEIESLLAAPTNGGAAGP